MAGIRGRADVEEGDDDYGVVVTPAVKVNKARQLFGVKGDEILAQNLQDKEFQVKYSWNREVRQIARKDVPLAKATHDEEEERLQRERLEFLQNQSRIAVEDAKLARQYQNEEQLASERERLTHLPSATGDDGLTEEERKQLMLLQDEELALALQEHEQMKALRSERSQIRARLVAEEHVAQPVILVVPAVQQENFQRTAASRRLDDAQSLEGSVRGAGYTSSPSSQSGLRPLGPQTHPAPRAPVYQLIQKNTTRNANDVSDKSVTLVTSVGKSEFFRTIPATETTSKESNTSFKSSRIASGTQRESLAETNRSKSAHSNRKPSNEAAVMKANIKKQ